MTDPAINSEDKELFKEATNLGLEGIDGFYLH